MNKQTTTEEGSDWNSAKSNDSAITPAGGPTFAPTTGENHRRNRDDPTRVFAGSVLGYCRVSRADQNLQRQVDALQAARCDRIFQDQGVSGSKSSRPGLDELLGYARPGDVIVVQALDRLGRNTRHLLTLVDSLHERHVSLRILTLGVDTATPAGQLVMTVMAALAAMEKAILVERVHSGLESARKRGRVGGRPPSLSEERRSEVLRMKGNGRTVAEIARLIATSERTVRRVLKAKEAVSSDS
jgi:DNA invertase Pin-like site-specific DNA recombinase